MSHRRVAARLPECVRRGGDGGMTELVKGDDIALAVDTRPCESDRVFFGQHPERNFRLRPAWGVEIEDFARRGGIVRELSNGLCWWILFTNLFPTKFGCIGGWRLRIPSFLTRPRTSCAASGAGASHARPARVRAPSNA